MNPFSDLIPNNQGSNPFSDLTSAGTQQPKKSLADQIWSGLTSVSQGAAKGAIQGINQGLGGLATIGGGIEAGLDQTLGRVGNVIAGNGFKPTNTAQNAFQGASDLNAAANIPQLTPNNQAEKVGSYIGQGADLLVTPPGSRAASVATPLAVDATKAALSATKAALTKTPEEIAAKEAQKIADIVSPKLTAKETTKAIASRGTSKTGMLGKIELNPDPAAGRIAETIKQFVPDFNPKATLSENISATKQGIARLAQDLKSKVVESGQDAIYSFKELGSALRKVERPTMIAADSTLNRAYDLIINKALDIARKTGGKVSDLLPMRQELDNFIEKQFPNLYSSDTLTPMRQGIKDIRNAITDFTIEHLPQDVGMRESYTHQTRLFDAVENMAEKAASGSQKEVGTNAIQRAAKRHPTATKVLKYGAAGVAGGAAVHATGL